MFCSSTVMKFKEDANEELPRTKQYFVTRKKGKQIDKRTLHEIEWFAQLLLHRLRMSLRIKWGRNTLISERVLNLCSKLDVLLFWVISSIKIFLSRWQRESCCLKRCLVMKGEKEREAVRSTHATHYPHD